MSRILILCTGNSCRSQMAEAYLRSLDPNLEIYSAGTQPAATIHPRAVQVMKEIGIDISNSRPKRVDQFIQTAFDYVITVCDSAKEACPVFTGNVRHRLHIGFDDPAEARGTDEQILFEFRRVRDEIRRDFKKFYEAHFLS